MKILEFRMKVTLIRDFFAGGRQKWATSVAGTKALLLTPIDDPIIFENPYVESPTITTKNSCKGWIILMEGKVYVLWNFSMRSRLYEPWKIGWCHFLDVDSRT